MTEKNAVEGMLSPYRALDLTDEKGYLCGRLLGDLGADVLKIETPGGDPDRNQGPFYQDKVDPEKSLFWFAYNNNKRGITLDIEKAEGQDILKKLVKSADFLIESFPPGYMDRLGLGYSTLGKINPGLIMVAITPFGQTGPYKDFKGPDIVVWAMGGRMYSIGEDDRPPTRISHHSQAYLQGGLEAATGAMLAFYHRQMTGEGQYVDVSIQAAAAQQGNSAWDSRNIVPQRTMPTRSRLRITRVWQCKDGKVSFGYAGGRMAERFVKPFLQWMENEGMADSYLTNFDWEDFDMAKTTQATIDRIEEPIARFFASFTKEELLEGAVRNRMMFYPTFNTADILQSPQLDARDYWEEVEHPELKTSILYPGAFAKISGNPVTISKRPPLIGEHNHEIYQQELGLSPEEFKKLEESKVI
ncbi:MAG: CoA transferase [Dehalococcoidales bacterium]|nr:MAG: CoA transferase [Dehalococcoidales bacterium]